MARTTRRSREDEERAEYERLHAKYGRQPARRRREPEPDDDEDDDDGSVVMFSGRRADAFLDRIFGAGTAAQLQDDEDDDEDQDDEDDEDDEDDDEPDPAPPAGHGFFRSRSGRG